MKILLLLIFTTLFSCQSFSRINGDIIVEKNNPYPILFSPDMKEYRLYGTLAQEIGEKYNCNIVFLKGEVKDKVDRDGRIPFHVTHILRSGR